MKKGWILGLIIVCWGAEASNQRCRSYIPSSTPNSAFQSATEGTVLHSQTGVMWMRCSLGQQWDGQGCTGRAQKYTWSAAEAEAARSQYAGFSDWRLPTRDELESIVERRCETPSINSEIFPDTPSNWYWTASTPGHSEDADHLAWYVSFSLGRVHNQQKTLFARARLVRPGTE